MLASLASDGSYGTTIQSCHMTFDVKFCPKIVNSGEEFYNVVALIAGIASEREERGCGFIKGLGKIIMDSLTEIFV
jgi:hypothetical protein